MPQATLTAGLFGPFLRRAPGTQGYLVMHDGKQRQSGGFEWIDCLIDFCFLVEAGLHRLMRRADFVIGGNAYVRREHRLRLNEGGPWTCILYRRAARLVECGALLGEQRFHR